MLVNNIIKSLKNGWSLFSLPRGQKFPPPKGWTGKNSEVSDEMIEKEKDKLTAGGTNVGIRLSEDVVGIDLDDSQTPSGASVRAIAGQTHRVSSTDGVERFTAFYRLPEGLTSDDLMNVPGVDLITHAHRYTVLGIHPSGREYKIFNPQGERVEVLPPIEALEYIPEEIIRIMRRGKREKNSLIRKSTQGKKESDTYKRLMEAKGAPNLSSSEEGAAPSEWIPSDASPCYEAVQCFNRGITEVLSYWSAHIGALKALKALEGVNEKGHSVGDLPLKIVEAFLERAGEDRTEEANRMIEGLDFSPSECDCKQEDRDFFIDQRFLDDLGLEREECEAEVWIRIETARRNNGLSFPSVNHRRSYEKKTAMSIALNLKGKEQNRRIAEKAHSDSRLTIDESFEVSRVMSLIESLTSDKNTQSALFLIAYGFSIPETASSMGLDKGKIYRMIKKVKKEAKDNEEKGF